MQTEYYHVPTQADFGRTTTVCDPTGATMARCASEADADDIVKALNALSSIQTAWLTFINTTNEGEVDHYDFVDKLSLIITPLIQIVGDSGQSLDLRAETVALYTSPMTKPEAVAQGSFRIPIVALEPPSILDMGNLGDSIRRVRNARAELIHRPQPMTPTEALKVEVAGILRELETKSPMAIAAEQGAELARVLAPSNGNAPDAENKDALSVLRRLIDCIQNPDTKGGVILEDVLGDAADLFDDFPLLERSYLDHLNDAIGSLQAACAICPNQDDIQAMRDVLDTLDSVGD